MKEIIRQFKSLTGYSLEDIGKQFGVSRQYIYTLVRSQSLTYQSALAYFLEMMIMLKISLLEIQIEKLGQLRSKIRKHILTIKEPKDD